MVGDGESDADNVGKVVEDCGGDDGEYGGGTAENDDGHCIDGDGEYGDDDSIVDDSECIDGIAGCDVGVDCFCSDREDGGIHDDDGCGCDG